MTQPRDSVTIPYYCVFLAYYITAKTLSASVCIFDFVTQDYIAFIDDAASAAAVITQNFSADQEI